MYRNCKMNLKKNDKKILLELLPFCNLNCSHCFYRSSKDFSSQRFLAKEKIYSIINKLVKDKINKLVLTGGEPTLHPNFIEVSEKAISKIPKVSICTNGVISNNKLEDKVIELNFSNYTISVDSHIKEVHDKFRDGKGSFEKTLLFIKKLKSNKKIYQFISPFIQKTLIILKKQLIFAENFVMK